jgi:outer membrane protein assembly factor BamB
MPIALMLTATVLFAVPFSVFSLNVLSHSTAPVVLLGDTSTSSNLTAPTLLWKYSLGNAVYSPAVSNGVVYVGTSGSNIYALNAENGSQVWNYSANQEAYTSPTIAVADGAVYVGGFNNVFAINAKNGAQLWDDNYGEDARYFNSPVIVNGVVYSGAQEGGFSSFNAKSGQLLWGYAYDNQSASSIYVTSSAAVANDKVYFAESDQIYALNAATGAKLWNYSIGGDFWSTPAMANGIVYAGTGAYNIGNVYALNATDGTKIWNYTTDASISSSPLVANGIVYISAYVGTVYALNATSGIKLWNSTTSSSAGSGAPSSSPIVVGNVVYIGSGNGNVYAFDATSGSKLWNFTVGNTYLSSPAIDNGVLYIGSANGNVYSLRVSPPSPSTPIPSVLPLSSYTQLIEVTFLAAVIVVALVVVLVLKKKIEVKR